MAQLNYQYAEARWSPNFWQGRKGYKPEYIVMHGTDGSFPGAVDWLTSKDSVASVHYMIGRDGHVYQLVQESDSAWGNGVVTAPSIFLGKDNPNLYTISIEHERWNGNTTDVTPEMIASSIALVSDIRGRYGNIPLIPHSDIDPVNRARCPGVNFPLKQIDSAAKVQDTPVWVKFDAQAGSHLPVVFYNGSSFGAPRLYESAAKKGTVLHFIAWKHGDAVYDPAAGQEDRRWYLRADSDPHAWTPGAYLQGNPPNSTP